MRCPALCLLALIATACGGSNQYNFARTYEPLRAEKPLYERTQTPPYEDVLRDPVRYSEDPFSWFGVVEAMQGLPEGRVRITLGHRMHQARHLCSERAERSCRLTVSQRGAGPFIVEIIPRAKERKGQDRIWVGSLLRVYGTLDLQADSEDGPVVEPLYYRHWPRGTFVTTGARATMRR